MIDIPDTKIQKMHSMPTSLLQLIEEQKVIAATNSSFLQTFIEKLEKPAEQIKRLFPRFQYSQVNSDIVVSHEGKRICSWTKDANFPVLRQTKCAA